MRGLFIMKVQHQYLSEKNVLNGGLKGNRYRRLLPEIVTQEHSWISVIDPRNQRSLLQACDDCGIVKSENSIIKNCRATPGKAMVSSSIGMPVQRLM